MRYRVIVWFDLIQWYSYRTVMAQHDINLLSAELALGNICAWCVYEEQENRNREGQNETHLVILEGSENYEHSMHYPF